MTKILTQFLDKRKIIPEVSEEHGLQIRSIRGKDMVVFPYVKDGQEYGHKARSLDKSDWHSSPDRDLYNIDSITSPDPYGPIILTEGEIDCLSIIQSGFARVASLPNGWSSKAEIGDKLDSIETFLQADEEIIIAPDADEAGESLPHAVYRHMWSIMEHPCVKYCVWPRDCKDANDVLMKYGEEKLRECIEQARRIDPPGGVIHGIMSPPPMPKRRRLFTGTFVDDVVPFETRELSVCTGYPGGGKSHMALFVALHIAKKEGVKIGAINMETDPHRLRDQAFRMETNGQSYEHLSFESRQKYQNQINWLDETMKIVTPEEGHKVKTFSGEEVEVEHRREWLLNNLWALIKHDKCKFIFIDPWNEIQHHLPEGETMTQYCNDLLSDIRKIANAGDVHICVLAHPTKALDLSVPPTGHKIADSAAFFNKPGAGWTVHYYVDEPRGIEDCLIMNWKLRNSMYVKDRKGRPISKGRVVDMILNQQTQMYWPADPEFA